MGNRTVPRYKRVRLWSAEDDLPSWDDLERTSDDAVEATIFDPGIEEAQYVDVEYDELDELADEFRRDAEERSDWENRARSGMRTGLFTLCGMFLFVIVLTNVVPSPAEQRLYYETSTLSVASMTPIAPTIPSTPIEPPTHLYPSIHWMGPVSARMFAESEEGRQILCLAQVLQSETDDEMEMMLIGWVVKNRVNDDRRRWGNTICSVAYWPGQFSGLNAGDPNFDYNTSLSYSSLNTWPRGQERWETAIRKAIRLYSLDMEDSPLPDDAFHFYAPVGMKAEQPYPYWAKNCKAIFLKRDSADQTNGKIRLAIYRESTCSSLNR